jgi:RNA polymerase sigma-70 factor, ECF subfamily
MPEAEQNPEDVLRLFLQHQSMLSGFLYCLVEDWEIVEEALQDTALYICKHQQDFTPGTNFSAWARTVARMRCRELISKRKRDSGRLQAVSVADPITDEEWNKNDDSLSSHHKEALAQCLKQLPERLRRVIEMRYVEKLQCDRIAEFLNKSVESTYMTLTRLRGKLKECVEDRLARDRA